MKYINEFPSHTHAWAQSDRYSLAKGFVNNNLNFFKPETYVLNHQFPDNWASPSKESITAVEFPIHDYIPAIFMKLSKNSSPWVFRLYTLLYSFIGLFFLYKLAFLLSGNIYKSVLTIIFAASSPVYVYYQAGFLPTIPSLSNAIIGLYFYTNFLKSKKNKDFNISILFLTLAALSRTTFAIPLIALFCLESLRILQKKSILTSKILPILLSIIIIASSFLYNAYLRELYGSIFLNHILPASNLKHAIEILATVKKNWILQYFSITHYIIFATAFGLGLFSVIFKRKKLHEESISFLMLTIIILLGCIAFTLLMLQQFNSHDYYFIDTFYLPIIMLLIIALVYTPTYTTQWASKISILGIFIISIPLVISANKTQETRRISKHWNRTNSTINNFRNTAMFLDSLNIADSAKLLVIDAYAPNIPFILMNRKGYAIMVTSRENIENSLTWDYDYIVTQNEFFVSDIYSVYPEIINKTKKIWDNGYISISNSDAKPYKQSLYQYLDLDKKTPYFTENIDFESEDNQIWQNTTSSTTTSFTGEKSGFLSSDQTFGLTYKNKNTKAIKNQPRTLFIQTYCYQEELSQVNVIVSINEKGRNTYYKSYNILDFLHKENEWQKINLFYHLPKANSENYELAIYFQNTGKSELYIDDFEFRIY